MRNIIPVISLIVFLLPGVTWGAANQFTVSFRMSNDSTPPTTPDPVTATPVASSQIDVTWGASTDNDILAGYRLFRDGQQIATTTLTSYADTGLMPSTTYSYYVQAYDDTLNISSSSVTVATTTLRLPVTPNASTTVGPAPTRVAAKLLNLDIATTETTATLRWDTNIYVRFVVRWGKTAAYELGSVQSEVFRREHATHITDLEPGTRYVYEITAYSQQGREYPLKQGSFTTAAIPDTIAPPNVENLKAVVDGDDVQLSWINPVVADFSRVRIVRNHRFFPNDVVDGYIAYEGQADAFFDPRAFTAAPVQYYTVFTYDTHGNISSGAVIRVTAAGVAAIHEQVATSTRPIDVVIATTAQPITTEQSMLKFGDITFIQYDQLAPVIDGVVELTSGEPFHVIAQTDVIPVGVHTLIISFGGSSFERSYLLRMSKDGTAYEAYLPALLPGRHPSSISVFSRDTHLIATASGTVAVQAQSVPVASAQPWWRPFVSLLAYAWWLILILGTVGLYWWWRRKS